jgi:hypothetical protein
MKSVVRSFRIGAVVLTLLAAVLPAGAQIITLTDLNSVAQVDVGSQSGMFNWFVDGNDYMAQQWFWYRIGGAGPESAINTIGAPTITLLGTRNLQTTYANASLSMDITYLLTGFTPGSGLSDITETIRIVNRMNTPLDLHFFQYSDFDLGPSDTVQLGKSMITGLFNQAVQANGLAALTETVAAPGASHGEVAFFPSTLNRLNDGLATTLNDIAGPAGPGDVSWALQWDVTIAPGGSFGISKDKYINLQAVPEPSALVLAGFGLAGLLLRRRANWIS